MPPLNGRTSGKVYWRSLDDLADKPEFRALVQREFPAFPDEMLAPSRRDFLKVMGASVALAGLTACRRWPAEMLVPFAHRPDAFVPGNPVQYATSFEIAGAALGLLVTCYDGRPVKVEGNPFHPASLGGTDNLAQAAVLQVYDPDRAVRVLERPGGQPTERSWDEFAAHARPVFAAHRRAGGRGLRVLCVARPHPRAEDGPVPDLQRRLRRPHLRQAEGDPGQPHQPGGLLWRVHGPGLADLPRPTSTSARCLRPDRRPSIRSTPSPATPAWAPEVQDRVNHARFPGPRLRHQLGSDQPLGCRPTADHQGAAGHDRLRRRQRRRGDVREHRHRP